MAREVVTLDRLLLMAAQAEVYRMKRSMGSCIVWCWLAIISASRAHADGAFADSKAVLLPSDRPQRILASTDVPGLVVSEDGGKTWSWVCENAIGRFAALFQLGPAPDERLYAVTQTGLSISEDSACSWHHPQGVTQRAGDVFPDPSNAGHVFSIVQTTAVDSAQYGDSVVQSSDGGATFGPAMYFTTEASLTGVEVARSDPRSIYLAMSTLPQQRPFLARSLDAGATWEEISLINQLDRKPLIIRIIAVDPSDARTLYIRVSDGQRDALAISHDGGDTLRVVQQLETAMSAFLLRADGSILLASVDGQSFRSDDAGESFAPWLDEKAPHFQALGERDGLLYAVATSSKDGFAIARSDDDGESWRPLLRLEQLRGPLGCGSVAEQCRAEWDQLQRVLGKLSGPPLAQAQLSAAVSGRGCELMGAGGKRLSGLWLLCACALLWVLRKVRSRAV